MTGIRLVKATAKCPHCDVRKHQIDGTEERALRIVTEAIEAHVREAHPDEHAEACPGCGERCDICDDRMCATWGPEPAVTCAAHCHCTDCDRDNPCRDCATARREAAA